MDDGMPKIILTITISLLILGIGIFSFFYVTMSTNQSIELQRTETFIVPDPSVDQTFTLKAYPDTSTMVVTQYTGFDWIPVDSTYISVVGRDMTIEANGMLG
jgi:hypothetical protein